MTEHEAAPPASPPPETNGLGLAGFIVSLIGLVSCGLISPIGLVLSFVGLFRQPKGFAIAGFVLGLLGSAWILALFVLGAFVAVLVPILAFVGFGGYAEAFADGVEISEAVDRYYEQNGTLPSSIDDLSGVESDDLEDFWGNQYRLEVDEQAGEIRVISNGPDGQPGNDDDIELDFDVSQ